MKQFDYLQIALVVNVVAIFAAIVTAILLAWNNAGSKNMPLAAAALVGVTVGYLLQLPFELVKSTDQETIGIELTIDRTNPVLRQWAYNFGSTGWRIHAEVGASEWLTKKDPKAFDTEGAREKATSDMIVFSVLSFLMAEEFDWQLERKKYGHMQTIQGASNPKECSSFVEPDIRAKLTEANNVFQGAPMMISSGKLCLPPGSALIVSPDNVTIRNHFCQIVFRVEHPAKSIFFVDPATRGVNLLPNGEARYETRTMGLNVETTFFRLRAQHPDIRRYRAWTTRLKERIDSWFSEAPANTPPQVVHP